MGLLNLAKRIAKGAYGNIAFRLTDAELDENWQKIMDLFPTPAAGTTDVGKVPALKADKTGFEYVPLATGGGGGGTWGSITGILSNQTDLQTALNGKVDENAAITWVQQTKITYDSKGLVTSGADATTADIADSTNKRYVTDANLVVIGNTSGTNTGDNATNSQYSGLAASKQDTLVSGTNIKTINSKFIILKV